MPGARSLLDRHEWVKHGTCYFNRSAETYFSDALRLTDELNRSAVRSYFAAMIGKTIRLSDVRRRFDESFGDGAGLRVRLACRSDGPRRLITELTLGLLGDPSEHSLRELLLASRPTDGGCDRGEVDEAGLQ
jgi:ribonuclease T2